MALVVLVVSRGGLKGGLERAVTILMPALFLLLLLVVGYATTTGHFGEAVSFLFTPPNFEALTVKGVLVALGGHAFFTLSLGMAIMMLTVPTWAVMSPSAELPSVWRSWILWWHCWRAWPFSR